MERCAASAHHRSNLGNKSVACWGAFSALCHLCGLFRLRRPTTLHIAPFCPQRSCCGLFCVFRASLLFSTSVNLKFRHFKFRAKARRLHLMRPFWRSQKRFGAARSQRSWWSTDCIFAARKRRFFCISCRKHKKMQSARRRRSRRSSPPTTSLSPPNQQPRFFPH